MSICKVGEEVSVAMDTMTSFCNINPNLPSDITVGYEHNETIFCLDNGDDDDTKKCYKNIMPGIHRALSNFNLNDYTKPDNSDELEKDEVPLTPEDIDKLVPGMWLKCLYDINDLSYYEAMFLTTDIDQMNPNVEGVSIIGDNTDSIAIEFDKDALDEGEEAQKVVPISWCMPVGYDVYETSSNVDYMIENNVEPIFRRVFKELPNKQTDEKVLFSYSHHEATIVKDKDGYIKKGSVLSPLPAEMDTSKYNTVYSHLPFSHPEVQRLDNKFTLYQLYKDDPVASKVFPKSYSSYQQALLDTENEEDSIFYIKDSKGTRGEGIQIKSRNELSEEYQTQNEEGEYDIEESEGDVIIQRAVTDLYTIEGEDHIAGRRFDIRYYLLIAKGKVYLHRHFSLRWSQKLYDQNDTNVENQVINVAAYSEQPVHRLDFVDTPRNEWNNSAKKRRTDTRSHKRSDFAHECLDAISDALDDATSVFSNLKKITKSDPTKYVVIGGDSIIREDGSAVLVEFNVWPDMSYDDRVSKCLGEGNGCRPVVLMMDSGSDIHYDSQISDIVSIEGLTDVLKDTALMVMEIQPAHEIKGFREIVARIE